MKLQQFHFTSDISMSRTSPAEVHPVIAYPSVCVNKAMQAWVALQSSNTSTCHQSVKHFGQRVIFI